MNFLKTAGITVIFSALTVFGIYNFVPQSWYSLNFGTPKFGSTITTINGSDTISASRAVLNTNFANLNSTKAETTATTLSNLTTVGTITSGTWQGGIVGATWGGTGSSTLSKFSVLLGSSTNPIGIVQGLGSSGQFLTSQGAGAPPSWTTAAIDLTANYSWTGSNLFKTLTASSTISFNNGGSGLSFTFPTGGHSASSTVLAENGSGVLSFVAPNGWNFYENTTQFTNTGSTATATAATVVIPANTFINGMRLELIAITDTTGAANASENFDMQCGTGSASTTVAALSGGASSMSPMVAYLQATSTLSEFSYQNSMTDQSSTQLGIGSKILPYSNAAQMYCSIRHAVRNSADTSRIDHIVVRQTL